MNPFHFLRKHRKDDGGLIAPRRFGFGKSVRLSKSSFETELGCLRDLDVKLRSDGSLFEISDAHQIENIKGALKPLISRGQAVVDKAKGETIRVPRKECGEMHALIDVLKTVLIARNKDTELEVAPLIQGACFEGLLRFGKLIGYKEVSELEGFNDRALWLQQLIMKFEHAFSNLRSPDGIRSRASYQKVCAKLRDLHVFPPDKFIDVHYGLRSKQIFEVMLSYYKKLPEHEGTRDALFKAADVRVRFLESRGGKEDLVEAWRIRNQVLDIAIESEKTDVYLPRIPKDYDYTVPEELNTTLLDFAGKAADFLTRELWHPSRAGREAKRPFRGIRNLCDGVLAYLSRASDSLETEAILQIRERLFEAEEPWVSDREVGSVPKAIERGDLTMLASQSLLTLHRADREFGLLPPSVAKDIASHLKVGLALIKESKYEEAYGHLSDGSRLSGIGIRVIDTSLVRLNHVAKMDMETCLNELAQNAWFIKRRGIEMMLPVLPEDYHPGSEVYTRDQHDLVKWFYHEVALIFAEEWCHAYQEALGSPISKKGRLYLSADGYEQDVAQYFHENEVPITTKFWKRYDRKKEFDNIYAVKNKIPRVQEWFAEKLAELQTSQVWEVGKADFNRFKSSEVSELWKLFDAIGEARLKITKASENELLIEPICVASATKGQIFIANPKGVWSPLLAPRTLSEKTYLRLGPYIEVELSC